MEEVIGLPYLLKTEGGGNYSTNIGDPKFLTTSKAGYIEVITTGAGCLKVTKPVIEALYNSNYMVFFRNKQLKKFINAIVQKNPPAIQTLRLWLSKVF